MSENAHILVIDDEKNYLLVLQTLLEDAGYLPRVAYNLDRPFTQTTEESHCQYCDFKLLCKR